jgi:hypothetical protein
MLPFLPCLLGKTRLLLVEYKTVYIPDSTIWKARKWISTVAYLTTHGESLRPNKWSAVSKACIKLWV